MPAIASRPSGPFRAHASRGARPPGRTRRGALACAVLAALAGCEGGADGPIDVAPDGTMRLGVPPRIDVRAVDVGNLGVNVFVNGRRVVPRRDAAGFVARATVPEGEDVSVSVVWFERVTRSAGNIDELALVSADFTIESIDGDVALDVGADDYDDSGFDEDRDGLSNLAERNANTNAYDRSDPGGGFVRAVLPRIDPRDAPIMDGAYDAVWDRAQYRDTGNGDLEIDNLMIDFGAVLLDDASGYRWGALHDGRALYLIVFAESGGNQTPFGDSAGAFNDDSIDVYVDGDNSASTSYDGIDDRHVIVPLLDANGGANSSVSADARLQPGPNSAPFDPDAIEFATCLCPGGEQVYELRLPLDAFDLPVGEAFGFEVHINDDRDGGDRDVKWGWAHPSREDENVDFTFVNPSFMAPIRLRP